MLVRYPAHGGLGPPDFRCYGGARGLPCRPRVSHPIARSAAMPLLQMSSAVQGRSLRSQVAKRDSSALGHWSLTSAGKAACRPRGAPSVAQCFEPLETRRLLATFAVLNLADSGDGSL